MTLALPPSLLPFLVVAALIVVTPGPDMALVTRNAIASGLAAALVLGLAFAGVGLARLAVERR